MAEQSWRLSGSTSSLSLALPLIDTSSITIHVTSESGEIAKFLFDPQFDISPMEVTKVMVFLFSIYDRGGYRFTIPDEIRRHFRMVE